MKFLIVGFGSIGQRHALIVKKIFPDCQLVVCSKHCDEEKRKEFHVDNVVKTLEEAAELNPNAAIISNCAVEHIKTAITLLKTHTHILIEKPLSNTLENLDELEILAARHKAIVMVGYVLRFSEPLNKFREYILGGKLGVMYSIDVHVGQYLPDWRKNADYRLCASAKESAGGGALLELSHELDYLMWIFGYPTLVSSMVDKLSNLEIDVEDIADILLTFDSKSNDKKIFAHLHLNMLEKPASRFCKIIAEKGTLLWDGIRNEVRLYTADNAGGELLYRGIHKDRNTMFEAQLRHFIDCIENRKPPLVDISHAKQVLKFSIECKESMNSCVSI